MNQQKTYTKGLIFASFGAISWGLSAEVCGCALPERGDEEV